jgi:regulator of protease activity HflC (stomatin/prohibitin superfamily)
VEGPLEVAVGVAVEVVIVGVALGVLYRLWGKVFAVPLRHKVLAFQRGVVLRDGRVEKVIGAGTYWITPKRTLLVCDMRAKPFQVQGQEMLTQDGMGVRMSLGGEYRVTDPEAFVTASSDAFGTFYLELRQTLRASVAELNGEIVLNENALVIARMRELLTPKAAQLGIEMIQLEVLELVPMGWLREA